MNGRVMNGRFWDAPPRQKLVRPIRKLLRWKHCRRDKYLVISRSHLANGSVNSIQFTEWVRLHEADDNKMAAHLY